MTDWMPHGFCIQWDPHILILQVFCNAVIALAYFLIPWFLWRIVYKFRKGADGLGVKTIIVAFSIFICTCGLTHIMDILTIWQPLYVLDVVVRSITATASAVTAYGLIRILPLFLRGKDAARPE